MTMNLSISNLGTTSKLHIFIRKSDHKTSLIISTDEVLVDRSYSLFAGCIYCIYNIEFEKEKEKDEIKTL